jgi:hypothetical protein
VLSPAFLISLLHKFSGHDKKGNSPLVEGCPKGGFKTRPYGLPSIFFSFYLYETLSSDSTKSSVARPLSNKFFINERLNLYSNGVP